MDLAAGIEVLALTSKHWIDIFRNASPEPLQKPGNPPAGNGNSSCPPFCLSPIPMTSFPFPSQVIQPDAEQAARRLRLPFSCCAWKGTQGHWEGTGAGNSIDFQGSRSYQWGG